jgi:probable F420-dependent oxidoreductase
VADRPPLDVGITLPAQDELAASDFVELARLAEQEGFGTVTAGEIAGAEALVLLGAIAQATRRIRIGSGVIAIYNRSPVLTGMAFASLGSLAPGRVFAGIGTGSHRVVEDWNGRELRAPLRTMREFVEILRAVLAGERVAYDGEELHVTDYRLQHPLVPRVPVFVAAFHPGMLRLAGAIADGVMLALWPADELAARVAAIHEGARAVGRDPAQVEITASVHAYVGPRVDEALDRFRRFVLEYAVRPTHRAAYEGSFPEIDRATELWNAGERKQALALVPDEAVRRLLPIGPAETVVERLAATRAAGVTTPLLVPHALTRGDAATPRATISAVAAALGGVTAAA